MKTKNTLSRGLLLLQLEHTANVMLHFNSDRSNPSRKAEAVCALCRQEFMKLSQLGEHVKNEHSEKAPPQVGSYVVTQLSHIERKTDKSHILI